MARVGYLLISAVALSYWGTMASARTGPPAEAPTGTGSFAFALEAQPLSTALRQVGQLSGREILFEAATVRDRRAPALRGRFTAVEAVRRLLAGSGLVVIERHGALLVRQGRPSVAVAGSVPASAEAIVVTGSRIRGAPATSPVTSTGRERAQQMGQTDLGGVIRALPQNFAGGQNPTIAGPGQGGTQNTTGSSSINLRGLGPDASLTLVNGHRMAFDAIYQGVDIAAIPLEAIVRIDVVADGASALYGSDAIGGVANVILRQEFDGLRLSAGLAAPTRGGALTRHLSAMTGAGWASGGFMVAGEYRKSGELAGRHRDFLGDVPPDATVVAGLEQRAAVAAGRQDLSERLTLGFDATYLHRSVPQCLTVSVTAPSLCAENGSLVISAVDSWSVSPVLTLAAGSGWTVRLAGTYAQSDSAITNRIISGGSEVMVVRPRYDNDLRSAELGAEGPLFALPGGSARLALGAGYRSVGLDFDVRSVAAGVERPIGIFDERRNVAFAYGEIHLPLAAPNSAVPLLDRLDLVGALRFEDHEGIGEVVTPKLGLVYAPLPGLVLRGSWGRSFKAPTLFQLGQASDAQLIPNGRYSPAPPSAGPVLYLFGGNPELTPERATTWSASLVATPVALEGFRAELGYFRIRYRQRVAQPIEAVGSAFLPVYANFVQLAPGAAEVEAALAGISGVFTNLSGVPFDPSTVSAIIRNTLQNVTLQSVEGVDLTLGYEGPDGPAGRLVLEGSATYLDSERSVTPELPVMPQAGVVFTPPHWRGRLMALWEGRGFDIAAVTHWTGGLTDNRFTPATSIDPFATVDLTLTLQGPDSGPLAGAELRLGIANLFDKAPQIIRTSLPALPPYDSLNQSPFGRIVSLTLAKTF